MNFITHTQQRKFILYGFIWYLMKFLKCIALANVVSGPIDFRIKDIWKIPENPTRFAENCCGRYLHVAFRSKLDRCCFVKLVILKLITTNACRLLLVTAAQNGHRKQSISSFADDQPDPLYQEEEEDDQSGSTLLHVRTLLVSLPILLVLPFLV